MGDRLMVESSLLDFGEEQKLLALASAIDAAKRRRYRYLRRQWQKGCLRPTEHQELIKLTDEVEMINVARMELLAEVGKRHHLSLAETVRRLHIVPLLR